MEKLFGTDGIRQQVGKFPLTAASVFALGRTIGIWLKAQYPRQEEQLKIVIGKDTRDSGQLLEMALIKGAGQEKVKALRVGVCPTPAIAYLTQAQEAHLGLAISASHNPGCDNGIKFFDRNGRKLFTPSENQIEEIFWRTYSAGIPIDSGAGLKNGQDYLHLYTEFAKNSLKGCRLSGMRVVLDCAFGSFSKVAPLVFRQLGAEVFSLHDQPNGRNINVNCGTLHPEIMAAKVSQHQADLGIAFDGDGDRLITADEQGRILDGDFILAILGRFLQAQKRLSHSAVICTQMSNLGLELYLKETGIAVFRTPVGDKYVLEEMLKRNINLGGEQSGHIIMLERTSTGDGLIAALALIEAMRQSKKRLSELGKDLHKFPQVLINIKVKEKKPLEDIPGFNEIIKRSRLQLGKFSRILVRYSGTESLARVMVEAEKKEQVYRVAEAIAGLIKQAIGEEK